MSKIIGVIQVKGGAGRSTVSTNLAGELNANADPLSPYQAVAADFDQSGAVDLTDAIGLLKMVVGLNAPAPTWKYFDDAKLASAYSATQSLSHKSWSASAAMDASSTADPSAKLVGVLTGDVDGSWAG
jgi:CO dehydrogenase nickel-insertion accessory protein CooC1